VGHGDEVHKLYNEEAENGERRSAGNGVEKLEEAERIRLACWRGFNREDKELVGRGNEA